LKVEGREGPVSDSSDAGDCRSIDWTELQELFFAALERGPEARSRLLDEVCAGRPELRAEVEGMLAAHDGDAALDLESWLVEADDRRGAHLGADLADTDIGPYRLLRLLGRGGMGEVYLAERADDHYRQQVAVKLMRPGLSGTAMMARFRVERQILAELEHPNITTLLDGGVTEDDRPYLVLQYIDGVPIDDYCDQASLSIDERLELFVIVCEAVQFAHGRLVVHRDLKPSNILVTKALANTTDGAQSESGKVGATVKLLDFGIAKLLDSDAVSRTQLATRTEGQLLTPAYAAPEQLAGGIVSTATDVYALGVVLYRLLCGRSPYAEAVGLSNEPPEIRRMVTALDARDPGGRGATAAELAQRRSTRPDRLRRLLCGDVERIVEMALRPEAQRRYPSAGQLAEDVRRYLEGHPVVARPASPSYLMERFIRRHRGAVAAVALSIVTLIGFSAVTAVQARHVARERDRAQLAEQKAGQVVELLVDLFRTSDPQEVPGGDQTTVAEFLEDGEHDVEELGDQSEVQAKMWHVLGRIHLNRSRFDRAQDLLSRALAQQIEISGGDDPLTDEIYNDLARLNKGLGDLDQAADFYRRSMALRERVYKAPHVRHAEAMVRLGTVLPGPEGTALLERGLAVRRELETPPDMALAEALNQLALRRIDEGRRDEARDLLKQCFEILEPLAGEEHPHTLTVLNNYAHFLEPDEKLPIQRRVLEIRRRVNGPESAGVGTSLNNVATTLGSLGRWDEALASFREARDVYRATYGPEHALMANAARNIGRCLAFLGRPAEAIPYLSEAVTLAERATNSSARSVALYRTQLAVELAAAGRDAEALAEVRRVEPPLAEPPPEAERPEHHGSMIEAHLMQAFVEWHIDAQSSDIETLRYLVDEQVSIWGADHVRAAEARSILAAVLASQGQAAAARPHVDVSWDRFTVWPRAHPFIVKRARAALDDLLL